MIADSHLRAMLIRHEGMRLEVYVCPAGKATIGVGRNLEDLGISEEEALFMLSNDISRARKEAGSRFPWFTGLSGERQDVVISMVINLGITRFMGFKKLHAALLAGNWEKAASEMLSSTWAAQVKGRAVELSQLMRSGRYQS